MERPIRANANRHPAQILRDAVQKRRTAQQKEADEAAAAEQRAQAEGRAKLAEKNKISAITSAADTLRKEDKQYGREQKRMITHTNRITALRKPKTAIEDQTLGKKVRAL